MISINDLREFKDNDLFEKLNLSDEDFVKRWLVPLGLFNGRILCTCGNNMFANFLIIFIIQ